MQSEKMTKRVFSALVSAMLFGQLAVALPSNAPEAQPEPPAAVCKEAIVNPVSGYAECVLPRGAKVDPPPPRPRVIKLAIFDFEFEDATPAAALLGQTASVDAAMKKVNSESRRMFERSGHYLLIDLPTSIRKCEGCEAGIALEAGADQALLGVVRRITQTDYYVVIQIRDAQTGKVLDQQAANFAGGPDGWASGVRMLIKHQVLASTASPL